MNKIKSFFLSICVKILIQKLFEKRLFKKKTIRLLSNLNNRLSFLGLIQIKIILEVNKTYAENFQNNSILRQISF